MRKEERKGRRKGGKNEGMEARERMVMRRK